MNYSIILAVETYCDTRISKVDYAENDAREFAHSIKNIGYFDYHMQLLINNTATKTMIESKIRQTAKMLTKSDKIIFYYAGHGFANAGQNYITCYDTVIDDIEATSISIQFIFEAFKNRCSSVLYFLDSCHSGLNIDKSMRGLYSDLNKLEFVEALKDKTCHIGFAACTSDEYSYPVTVFKHGAWTYHLIEAFNGLAEEALEKGSLLTVFSLQNYLSRAVPITLKRAFTTPRSQSPWIFGGTESDIVIGDLTDILKKNATPSPNIIDIEFYIEKMGSIKSLSGFKKSHTVPSAISHATEMFVHSISQEELSEETQKMHDTLRSTFGFKRKDISFSESEGQKSILTPEFVIHLTIDQSEQDCREYIKTLRLTEISNKDIIKNDIFNTAFSDIFDTLIIKLDKNINIYNLIDHIEELDNAEIELDYPPNCTYCDIKVRDISGSLRVSGDELIVELSRPDSPMKLASCIFGINEKLIQLNCQTKLLE